MADIELADALTELATVNITTDSGTPTDITLQDASVARVIVNVTTDGSGGAQTLNLPLPATPIDGFANNALVGQQYCIMVTNQADPGDAVTVTVGGGGQINTVWSGLECSKDKIIADGGLVLDFAGAGAVFVWAGDGWLFDYPLTDGDNSITWRSTGVVLGSNDGTVANQAQSTLIKTGNQASGSNIDGADITVAPGTGDGAGRDGLIILKHSGAAGLPTADPMVAGALWNSSGTVKISAG